MASPRIERFISYTLFGASAIGAAWLILLGWRHPWWGSIGIVLLGLLWLLKRYSEKQLEEILLRHDSVEWMDLWQSALVDDFEENPGLKQSVTASVWVNLGEIEKAERVLSTLPETHEDAAHSRAVVILLLGMLTGEEGDTSSLLNMIEERPLPSSPWERAAEQTLRRGLRTLNDAYRGRELLPRDIRQIKNLRHSHPIFYWPASYALVIDLARKGKIEKAQEQFQRLGQPTWPESSVFASFNQQLLSKWPNASTTSSNASQ